MKSLLQFTLLAPFTVLFISCNKNDDQSINLSLAKNTWMVGDERFEAVHGKFVQNSDGMLFRVQSRNYHPTPQREFFVTFTNVPTADGEYDIKTDNLSSGNVFVATNITDLNDYTAFQVNANNQSKVKVYVLNGKVHIIVPSVWAKRLTGPGPDSVKIAADLSEE